METAQQSQVAQQTPKKSKIEIHLIRHMKTGKAEGFPDALRTPNEKGKEQVMGLREVLASEATEFDHIFYSPTNRTYCMALAISNAKTTLVEIPELGDPNPQSTDKNEVIDAAILLKGTDIYGYDWAGWWSNSVIVDAFTRRAQAAVVKIQTVIRKLPVPTNPKPVFKIGIVGHYLYLNALGLEITNEGNGRDLIKETILGECDRFVLKVGDDGQQIVQHVPLGETMYHNDPQVPD